MPIECVRCKADEQDGQGFHNVCVESHRGQDCSSLIWSWLCHECYSRIGLMVKRRDQLNEQILGYIRGEY